jgi:hypothetical protein
MTKPVSPSWPLAVLVTVAGPVAVGAALGLPFGPRALLTEAAVVPAVVLGLTLLMVPALYIGTSLLGVAPPAASAVTTVGYALKASGTVLLGLAAPTAFLLATTSDPRVVRFLAVVVVAASVLCGLRILYLSMFHSRGTHLRALPVFVAWAFVCGAIGARLLTSTLPGS